MGVGEYMKFSVHACVCLRAYIRSGWMKKPSRGKYLKPFHLPLDAEKQQPSRSECNIPKSEIPAIIHGGSTAGAQGNMSAPLSGQRRLTAPL